MPRLLFVYYMPDESFWMDGLYMALLDLEEHYTISRLNLAKDTQLPEDESYDFVLGWGAFNSPVDTFLQLLRGKSSDFKMGLCIAGNSFPPTGALLYDVLFYETKWYRPQIDFHPNIIHAFGVNTDIFSKVDFPTPVVWDYIGVGSLSSWKRWEKMATKRGNRLVVGEFQTSNVPESSSIAISLLQNHIQVSNMVHPFDLAMLYSWARTLYVPADIYGGGERSVWEAKACGLDVEVEDDNPKLQELVAAEVRDHHHYASQLQKGIQKCIST